MYDRATIIAAAEAAMPDENWPIGDSIENYEQVRAQALPSTDAELVAAIHVLYCAEHVDESLRPASYLSEKTSEHNGWDMEAMVLGQFVVWIPINGGCSHVEEFSNDFMAVAAAQCFEEPYPAPDPEIVSYQSWLHARRLGRKTLEEHVAEVEERR